MTKSRQKQGLKRFQLLNIHFCGIFFSEGHAPVCLNERVTIQEESYNYHLEVQRIEFGLSECLNMQEGILEMRDPQVGWP